MAGILWVLPYLTLAVTEQGNYSGLTEGHRHTECPANPLLRFGLAHLHNSSAKDGCFLVVFLSLSSKDKGVYQVLCKLDPSYTL